jgi:hypothetical protein
VTEIPEDFELESMSFKLKELIDLNVAAVQEDILEIKKTAI